MSQQVHYKGKIQLVEGLKNEPLKEKCRKMLEDNNVDLSNMDEDDIMDEFYDYFYEKYIIIEDNIYKVLSIEDVNDYDVFNVRDNKDGIYDYEISYYNGGCSFEEAINRGFKEMTKDNYAPFTAEMLNLKPDDVLVIKYEPNIIDLNRLAKIEELFKNKIPNEVLAIPTNMKLEKWKELNKNDIEVINNG